MTKLLQRTEEYKKWQWKLACLIMIGICAIMPTKSFATHIVGGDLTYRCLGNDRYEVTLMFYRDCVNASEEADFDDPASIAIFNANNALQVHLGQLGQILIPFNADDTLSLASDCFMEGEDGVCVHRTIYKAEVELPFIPGGYQLVYQRCCRNESLSNIIDPLESGASFVTEISETALSECNSSPVFREWPPIYICLNEQLGYDHSATDEDGDSLVYSLCTPLQGATFANPIPQPARKPPYEDVLWNSPYNLENLLGGSDPLTINQQGILSGTAPVIGQFLVGVCVEEYRNGVLIGYTKRDFEYNVVDCDNIVLTSFEVDTSLVCADVVDVQITNTSDGVADDAPIRYTVTSDKGLNLSLEGPDHTFQVNGRQTLIISQMVEVDSECTTNKSQSILIDVEDTGLGFMDTITVCEGSSVAINPGYSSLYEYTWSPTTYLTYADGPNPIAEPAESITYTATVYDPILDCFVEESIHIEVIPNPDVVVDFEVTKECNSLTVTFINNSTGADNFIWDFGDPTNPDFRSTERDPVYTYPAPATYDAVLTVPGDDCNSIRTKRLPVAGEDFMDFAIDTAICGPSLVDLNTGLNPLYLYQWENHPLIADVSAAVPEVYLREDATFNVTVTDPLNMDCQITGSFDVSIGDQLVVDLGDSIFTCEGGPIELNPNGDPDLIYMWTPAGDLDDPTSFNPTADVTQTTRYVAKITDPNDPTCMVRIPLKVIIGLDDGGFEDGDSLIICDSSSFFLNPGANPNLVYVWSPTTGLDDPTHPNPIASPAESTTYTVTVSDSAGVCSIAKSIYIEIVPSDVLLNFDISKECNSLTLMFINTSQGATEYMWFFGDPRFPDSVSTEVNPTHTYPMGGDYEVELRSGDDPNCTAIRARRITITGEDFKDFSDTIVTCDPRVIPLNPDRNPNYIYAWAPDPAIPDTTAANPIISLFEDRTFRVTVTDPLNDTCTIEGEVLVFPNDTLIQNLPDSIIDCMPGTFELHPGGNTGFTYLWSPADKLDDPTSANPTAEVTETTVFTVTITDPNDPDCTITTELKVIISDYVPLITSESVDMVCIGDTVTLSAKGELVDSLTWCDPQGNVISNEATFEFPIEVSGIYTVKGVKGECTFVDSVYMGTRMLIFTLDPETPVCPGDPVEITLTSNSDVEIDSIMWSPMDEIVLGASSDIAVVTPEADATYTATVVFEDGCVVTDSVRVVISDIDNRFEVIADPDTIFFGEASTLTATLEDGATYAWTPADDIVSPNSNQTQVNPPETATYTVDITDANGCMTQKMVQVVVIMVNCNPPNIFLPNAFTPNGDGENDVLFLRGLYVESMELFIYDRWGELVFETKDQNRGWDGTHNGKELAPDVYGYNLMVQCIGGDQFLSKGNISLLR